MIHSIRKLAREIHRRSVWQVLAGFLFLSAVVIEGVSLVTRLVGLPLWTPTMTVILLAIGLPIVVATAVVQGGLPWLRIEDVVDPNELQGRTPAEVHVVPEAHPLYGVTILTWRNAILGGVMAGALLVTSVAAYLAMWALGIGPVGSLIAQGAIAEQDTIVVVEFDNRTEQPALAAEIRRTLTTALARSTIVNVVTEGGVTRPGIRALVTGDVAPIRSGYRITARIVRPNGATLATLEEAVDVDSGLEPAIELLSVRLRQRFGESLRVIQAERERVLDDGS